MNSSIKSKYLITTLPSACFTWTPLLGADPIIGTRPSGLDRRTKLMVDATDPRFLALLVHRGLLDAGSVKRALAHGGDVAANLVASGRVTRAQWDAWVRTEAGLRPELTRYELLEQLGQGGTARVWSARDRKDNVVVALKVLLPELCRDPKAVDRFVREARLLIDLQSPHLVQGYRVAREGETVYCAMELIEGRCLLDVLGERGRLEEGDALRIVAQIARALGALHARGLVHRDVKPGNVMLDATGRAVLIDLGFALDTAAAGGGDAPAPATTAGTAAYISPEQARGQQDLDVRADIYSLGATLYHLVTGSLPFDGRTSEELVARAVLDALSGEAIRKLGLSPQLHWFIEKMMAKDKEHRFQSPEQLAAEIDARLAQAAAEQELEKEHDARPRRPRRWL
jgi:serine/threonine-protein kinase